jgi:hypothetical protein
MLFPDEDDKAPVHVHALADTIERTFPELNRKNFFAFYRRYRRSFPVGERGDHALAAMFLTVRRQDPCQHGLGQYCPHANTLHRQG